MQGHTLYCIDRPGDALQAALEAERSGGPSRRTSRLIRCNQIPESILGCCRAGKDAAKPD